MRFFVISTTIVTIVPLCACLQMRLARQVYLSPKKGLSSESRKHSGAGRLDVTNFDKLNYMNSNPIKKSPFPVPMRFNRNGEGTGMGP